MGLDNQEMIAAIPTNLDELLDVVNSLYGLPAIALVAILCLVIGYALRLTRAFPDSGIPLVCTIVGGIGNVMFAPGADGTIALIAPRTKYFIVGTVVGLVV